MSRTAFLTGVTGFIGGRLAARLLGDGWAVHALVREASETGAVPNGVTLHRGDGAVEPLTAVLRDVRPDVVFHLASLYLADHRADQVDALVASNVLLPVRLAEAMTAAECPALVNTGTAWQHFGTDGYDPVNLYAATKQACVDLLRYFHEARGLSVVTLKLFDTFGAGDTRRKLVQLLVDAAVSGEPLGMSPGAQVVDLTHVEDVIDAFLIAADRARAPGPVWEEHLVSGERLSVRDLVDRVGRVLGVRMPVELGARPYRAREVMMPVAVTAKTALPGWRPVRRLDDEIARLRSGR